MIAATNNKGKLKEIKEILSDYDIYSLKEKNIDIEIIYLFVLYYHLNIYHI